MALKIFKANDNEIVKIGDRANKMVVNLSKNEKSKNLIRIPNIKVIKKFIFLTFNAKKAFNQLWLAFVKASILQYFDLKSYILVKINALSYAIGRMFSQLNLDSDISLNNLNSNK